MSSPEKPARPGPDASADLRGAGDSAVLGRLGAFIGRWRGEGRGTYPTITDFDYGEEIHLVDVGRPFLVYEQRTWLLEDGRPLHAEGGYWRPKPSGRIELLIAQATGMVEIDEGTLKGGRIRVASRAVASAATGPDVTSVQRELVVSGDELWYELRMAAGGQPLLVHLEARLRRVPAEP